MNRRDFIKCAAVLPAATVAVASGVASVSCDKNAPDPIDPTGFHARNAYSDAVRDEIISHVMDPLTYLRIKT